MAKKKRYHSGDKEMTSHSEGMFSGEHLGFANLPDKVIMKEWPRNDYFKSRELNDKLSGIDEQIDADVKGANRNRSKSKY